MSAEKRARYDGPSGTGVDLTDVQLVDGQVRSTHVPQGGLLPTDIGGVKVAASYRDGLLGQADWNLVRRGAPKKPRQRRGGTATEAAGSEDQAGGTPANNDGAGGAESTEE